jgi:3-methyl-2-oxobutanoate hydroxymethyltransferase
MKILGIISKNPIILRLLTLVCSLILTIWLLLSGAIMIPGRVTVADLLEAKKQGRKVVAVSCYDYTTARLVAQTDVEMILVGDSAAQVILGHDSTLPATMDFMVAITAAVRRGAPNVCLVADMPFLSYQLGIAEAVRNAGRFAAESGTQMIKIEASSAYLDVIRAVSDAGMAVMAHIGIRPQSICRIGRFKAEASTAEMAAELVALAGQMIDAGASALLLEGVCAEVARIITERNEAPVIGCGSGPYCDGQILIAPDILGLTQGPQPKFAKSYAKLGDAAIAAFAEYASQVRAGRYPDDEHSYRMKNGEMDRLRKMLENSA